MTPIATSSISLPDQTASCQAADAPARTFPCPSLPDLKQLLAETPDIVPADLADFRRAADNVRLAQLATLLCASATPQWSPDNTALIGLNGDGCAHNNRLFWNDFTSHGHDNGRASLFVPTLPSIPVCEAAIALAIRGPVRYLLTADDAQTRELLQDMFDSDPLLRQIMTATVTSTTATVTLYQR